MPTPEVGSRPLSGSRERQPTMMGHSGGLHKSPAVPAKAPNFSPPPRRGGPPPPPKGTVIPSLSSKAEEKGEG
ncbi:MAG TPA: hypothetical protein ENJ18_12155 [Nannocystis exedens]|nr:hypothetical protein [Nannocystis exedens]